MSKMYIAVLDEFPDYMTPTLVGHAVLRHHINYFGNWEYDIWFIESFKKVVVRVGQREFDKIRQLENITESWENNTLDGKVSCVTLIVSDEIPNVLKFAKLWKPNEQNSNT